MMKLRKNGEFVNVYKNGAYYADLNLTVYVLKNKKGFSRFGITAGKKVGGSVMRNRVTRLIREAIRKNGALVAEGFDIVALARAGSGGKKLAELEGSYVKLIKKSRAYINKETKSG